MSNGQRVYSYRLVGRGSKCVACVGETEDGAVSWADADGERGRTSLYRVVKGDEIVRDAWPWFESVEEAVAYHDAFRSSWAGRILREQLEHLDAVAGLEVE